MENTELRVLAYKIGERALKEASGIFDKEMFSVVRSNESGIEYENREIRDSNGKAGEIGYSIEESGTSRSINYDVNVTINCKTEDTMKTAKKVEKSFEGVGKSFDKIKLNVNLVKFYVDESDVDAFFKKVRTESL